MDGFEKSAGTDVSSPIPTPKFLRGDFSLHPRSYGGKISVLRALNGTIPAGIATGGCKLTSLIFALNRNFEIVLIRILRLCTTFELFLYPMKS
jgi:hypothetical protein